MALIDGLLQELEQETLTTRRVLERVPGNQLAPRRHERARTLGSSPCTSRRCRAGSRAVGPSADENPFAV